MLKASLFENAKNNIHEKTLDLVDLRLDDQDIHRLCEILASTNHLENLILHESHLTVERFRLLVDALTVNTSIKTIEFQRYQNASAEMERCYDEIDNILARNNHSFQNNKR